MNILYTIKTYWN